MIPEYAQQLARELDFDPPLSLRVRREVEDHLWEAASVDPSADRAEAERRAVANFGDFRAIAARFALVSLTRQARRLGVATVLLIAAAFVLMKARIGWYGLMQWPAADQSAFGAIVLSIDRCAFWLSFLLGIGCWITIDRRGIPGRRFAALAIAAAAALIVSVASDGLLTGLRLAGAPWSLEFLVPVFSLAIEVACAGVLVSNIRGLNVGMSATSRMR